VRLQGAQRVSNPVLYGHKAKADQCVEAVHNGHRSFSWHQCYKGRMPGSEYCRQHDPVLREARQALKQAQRNAEYARRREAIEAPAKRIKELEARLAEYDRMAASGVWISTEDYAKECQQALDLKTKLQDARMQIEELQQEIQGMAYDRGCF
jgi:predicted RNase H-like nuclease (RuvC/YqgF family)